MQFRLKSTKAIVVAESLRSCNAVCIGPTPELSRAAKLNFELNELLAITCGGLAVAALEDALDCPQEDLLDLSIAVGC